LLRRLRPRRGCVPRGGRCVRIPVPRRAPRGAGGQARGPRRPPRQARTDDAVRRPCGDGGVGDGGAGGERAGRALTHRPGSRRRAPLTCASRWEEDAVLGIFAAKRSCARLDTYRIEGTMASITAFPPTVQPTFAGDDRIPLDGGRV